MPGGRPLGSKTQCSPEYKELFEHLVSETGLHPVRVLFKLLRARKHEIKLQAARALLPYRYAVQRHIEVDAPTQLILGWDDDAADAVLDASRVAADGDEPRTIN